MPRKKQILHLRKTFRKATKNTIKNIKKKHNSNTNNNIAIKKQKSKTCAKKSPEKPGETWNHSKPQLNKVKALQIHQTTP